MLNLSSKINSISKTLSVFSLFACVFTSGSCAGSNLESQSNIRPGETTHTVGARNTPTPNSTSSPLADKLTELYEKKNCKEFINSFPDTFDGLDQLYGYDDETGPRPLYSRPEHINYYFECSDVSDLEKLKKVIRIAVRGKWDADSIGAFQEMALKLIAAHPKETEDILDSLPGDQAASVWYFVFDGPSPDDEEIVRRVAEMRERFGKGSKQSRIISQQYEKLKADSSHH